MDMGRGNPRHSGQCFGITFTDSIQILPSLKPRTIEDGASLLGAHAEGPYLHPSKKGAHNSSHFKGGDSPPSQVYGSCGNNSETLKLVTLAPEAPSSGALIKDLTSKGIKVSLGHSSASYSQGQEAVKAGATALTHTLNAMAPLHHRPGSSWSGHHAHGWQD